MSTMPRFDDPPLTRQDNLMDQGAGRPRTHDVIEFRGADPSPITEAVRGQSAYSTDAHLYAARTQLFHHWRHRAVELLPLCHGDVVLDVGCGTGLCFESLAQRIGPDGTIIGIDASADMLEVARRRADTLQCPVVLIEAPAEDAVIPHPVDHVLFCAVHDVLQSPAALRNVFAFARPGATVAAVGGKWGSAWDVGLNAMTAAAHAPFVRDFTGFDRPWAQLVNYLGDVRIEEIELGAGYLVSGRTSGRPPHRWHEDATQALNCGPHRRPDIDVVRHESWQHSSHAGVNHATAGSAPMNPRQKRSAAMTAPGEPIAELAKRGQEMVSSAVQSWADTVHAFASNSTADPTNAQGYVDTVFDFAEQVLASQREIARQWMSVAGNATEGLSQQTAQATRSAADSGIRGVQGAARRGRLRRTAAEPPR